MKTKNSVTVGCSFNTMYTKYTYSIKNASRKYCLCPPKVEMTFH